MVGDGASGQLANETRAFVPRPSSWGLSSAPGNATVGDKNAPSQAQSSIGALTALLRVAAVYPNHWGLADHIAFANAYGRDIGARPFDAPRPKASPTADDAPGSAAVLTLDPTNMASVALKFPLPEGCPTNPAPARLANDQVELCGQDSASVELPPVSCNASGPGLGLSLNVTLRSRPPRLAGCPGSSVRGERWTLLTVGDGETHVRLIAQRLPATNLIQMHLHCSLDNRTLRVVPKTPVQLGVSATVALTAAADGVSVLVDASGGGAAPLRCGCAMGGIWAFLGEGYLLRNYQYATQCVRHQLGSLSAAPLR